MEVEPWVEHSDIWKTESSFMSWVRGGIRGGLWKRHPVKLEFIKRNKEMVVNTNSRSMKRFPMVAAGRCALCNEMHSMSEIEVDHKTGNSSLRSMDDVRSFIESMILVSFDDLQLVCKPCHKIKTYAEKQGLSFEEAAVAKRAIEITNLSAEDVKAWILERGTTPAGTVKERKVQVLQLIKEEYNK